MSRLTLPKTILRKVGKFYDKAGVRLKVPGWRAMQEMYDRCADIARKKKESTLGSMSAPILPTDGERRNCGKR